MLMNDTISKPVRDTNLELFRIITMLLIVGHHYVVNSELLQVLCATPISHRSICLFLFGAWGKTGINCFVLITGYFMCKSNITLKKFVKLFGEVVFYNIVIDSIFWLTGYKEFSLLSLAQSIVPMREVSVGFISCYLWFFLTIPFLNILVHNMNEKEHVTLVLLCLAIYTFLEAYRIPFKEPFFGARFNYVSWFIVLYFIGSYISVYPKAIYEDFKFWCRATLLFLSISVCSVIWCSKLSVEHGVFVGYNFVSDSNTFLATAIALCSFMMFKNMNIGYSKVINTIAASTFGVLLIHDNSYAMRQWSWRALKNVDVYKNNIYWSPLHAVGSVLFVYIVCTLIDMLRIKFFEVPFFRYWDKHENDINVCVDRFTKKFWAILKIE